MHIGIIGPQSSCEAVRRNLLEIDPKLRVSCYARERVNQCGEVVEACEGACDGILFTGCAIERFVRENYTLRKPYAAIEKSSVSVAGALLEMQRQGIELDAFSIDVVENQVIEDLLDAFQIMARNIYHSSLQPGVDEEEYVRWHGDLQRSGKTRVALTSFAWVYHALREQNCQAIYLAPTRTMVRRALDALKSEYALNRAEYAQSAVVIFQISHSEDLQEQYYSSMAAKAALEPHLVRYAQSVQGAMFPIGRREYLLFTNAGVVEDPAKQSQLLQLQREAKALGMVLDGGIGRGITACQAEMNARKALRYSLKKGRQEIYEIDERDTMEGPVGREQRLKYELISSDPKIEAVAQKTGLSPESILKIIAIAEARQSKVFDAHQLAECLDITPRSARRIMNKLTEAGCGKVYAKETAASGGRPKTLLEIQFP